MIFKATRLHGVYIIEPEPFNDERGSFARTFCQREFEKMDLQSGILQCNVSTNKKKGTFRGMHYQAAPFEEAKLVSCLQGALYDIVLDLRPQSETFREWISVELNSRVKNMVYVPQGCAHGFQTLEENTDVFYQITEYYSPDHARGVRWNDPLFNITLPLDITMISEKDKNYPDFIS